MSRILKPIFYLMKFVILNFKKVILTTKFVDKINIIPKHPGKSLNFKFKHLEL